MLLKFQTLLKCNLSAVINVTGKVNVESNFQNVLKNVTTICYRSYHRILSSDFSHTIDKIFGNQSSIVQDMIILFETIRQMSDDCYVYRTTSSAPVLFVSE